MHFGIYLNQNTIRAYLKGWRPTAKEFEDKMYKKFDETLAPGTHKDLRAFTRDYIKDYPHYDKMICYKLENLIDQSHFAAKCERDDFAFMRTVIKIDNRKYIFGVHSIYSHTTVVGYKLLPQRMICGLKRSVDMSTLFSDLIILREIFYERIKLHFGIDMEEDGIVCTYWANCSIEWEPKIINDSD